MSLLFFQPSLIEAFSVNAFSIFYSLLHVIFYPALTLALNNWSHKNESHVDCGANNDEPYARNSNRLLCLDHRHEICEQYHVVHNHDKLDFIEDVHHHVSLFSSGFNKACRDYDHSR